MLEHRRALLLVNIRRVGARQAGVERVFDRELQSRAAVGEQAGGDGAGRLACWTSLNAIRLCQVMPGAQKLDIRSRLRGPSSGKRDDVIEVQLI